LGARSVLLVLLSLSVGCSGGDDSSDSSAASAATKNVSSYRVVLHENASHALIDARGGAYVLTGNDPARRTAIDLVTGDGTQTIAKVEEGVQLLALDEQSLYFVKASNDQNIYAADLDGRNVRTLGDPRRATSHPISEYKSLSVDEDGVFVVAVSSADQTGSVLMLDRETWGPSLVGEYTLPESSRDSSYPNLDTLDMARFGATTFVWDLTHLFKVEDRTTVSSILSADVMIEVTQAPGQLYVTLVGQAPNAGFYTVDQDAKVSQVSSTAQPMDKVWSPNGMLYRDGGAFYLAPQAGHAVSKKAAFAHEALKPGVIPLRVVNSQLYTEEGVYGQPGTIVRYDAAK
jgi:hypothetical protein